MAACRSCAAPIVWARTEAGKSIPLDAHPGGQTPSTHPDGNLTVIDRGSGGILTVRLTAPAPGLYRSHFATCRDAGEWRTRRDPVLPLGQTGEGGTGG